MPSHPAGQAEDALFLTKPASLMAKKPIQTMRLLLTSLLVSLMFISTQAQTVRLTPHQVKPEQAQWVQLMYSGAHPELVREAYEAHYAQVPFVKNGDTQYYKRFMRNYLFGADPLGAEGPAAIEGQRSGGGANWQEAGPWHYDPEVAMYFEVQSPGAFHAYTVEQAPSESNQVWTGTATAGIWKSTNKGLHWELMSHDLPVRSVYSIAIDPNDANTVYFGGENGGIWKSTNGGQSWALTGDAGFQNLSLWTRDLRIAPDNSNVLLAATNNGLYRSTDAGASWTQVVNGEHMEIEFHPLNPQQVYTVARNGNATMFRKSTDGGQSFTLIGNGWPQAGGGDENQRCEISVTPANPDFVYVLAAGSANGGDGLYGIYLSEDGGNSFDFQCCDNLPGGSYNNTDNPNILGWSEDGAEGGGQYYYDLALGASPTIDGRIYGAGINVWRSENHGSNWSLNAHWVTWAGEFTADRYTHADVHDIKFFETEEGVDMWVASDGGIFYSSNQGDNIEPRMYGIHGTDFWGWQAGWRDADVMVGGTYHNGTMIKNGDLYHWGLDDETSGGWLGELGGDNFRGFVNPGDSKTGYHDGGSFRYSDERFTRISGASFDNSKLPNTSYWWGEYGNMEWDPRCYNIIYSPVNAELWRSSNGGSSFELLHNFGPGKIISVKVAPRDPNRIYVSHRQNSNIWKIWRSTDQGASWSEITIPTSVGGSNNRAIYLDVDGLDPDKLWAIYIGNHNGNKVFRSANGGATWTNLTTETIASAFVASIAHQRGSNEGLYIGTDRKVFYRDANMSDWVDYDGGLPASTPTAFLQANYCDGLIRGAGSRGVHESPFFGPSEVQAGFMADRLRINIAQDCQPEAIHFSATSVTTCEGASYEWDFPGASSVEIDGPEAWVNYSTEGLFDVSLTVTDNNGQSDQLTREGMIEIYSEPVSLPLQEDFNTAFPPEGWKLVNSGMGGTWEGANVLGETGNGVAQFPNYWVDTQGEADLLVMPSVDISSLSEPRLHFDVAYRKYAEYNDGLEVWARTDDSEWMPIYSKFGNDLEVDDCYMWFWYDQGGELAWRTDTVDLSPFAEESCITLAFANIGAYGNHIWIDNVNLGDANVSVSEESLPTGRMLVYPNPNQGSFGVVTPDSWIGTPYQIVNLAGQVVQEGRLTGGMQVNAQHLSTGIYLMVVPGKGKTRIVIK